MAFGKTEFTNAMTLTTTPSQRRYFNSFSLFYIFLSHRFFYYLFSKSHEQRKITSRKRCEICSELTIKTPERRHWRRSGVFTVKSEHISLSHIVYFEFLLCNVTHSFKICTGGCFLEDCYSKQVISTVAKEFLIPYNLIKRAPEAQNL